MQQTIRRIRKNFGKVQIPNEIIPNLIELQENSYKDFLQSDVDPDKREMKGLQSVFKSMFPISINNVEIHMNKYELSPPKYSIKECISRDLTYEAQLKLNLSMVVFDINEETGEKTIKDIKEQDVFMGEVPLMTPSGSFIVKGVQKVVVTQLQRSPGVFFTHDNGKTHSSKKLLFSSKIIPSRGAWLDFEFDAKDILNIKIDKSRKIPATVLLKAISEEKVGVDLSEEILEKFYYIENWKLKGGKWIKTLNPELVSRPIKAFTNYLDAKTGKILISAGDRLTSKKLEKLVEKGHKEVAIEHDKIVGKFLAKNLTDESTTSLIGKASEEISNEILQKISEEGIKEVSTLYIDNINFGNHIQKTIEMDKTVTREDAICEIYSVLRPGEPATLESGETLLNNLFFDPARYDLSAVGRYKMNLRFGIKNVDDTSQRTLTAEDIFSTAQEIVNLKDRKGYIDDIDDLANRRIRPVGELIENVYRSGIAALERTMKEKIISSNIETLQPQDLVNSRPIMAVVKEFLGVSQLSQFTEQKNPLDELAHKRRISALGVGGLSKDRAGYEVRDVHTTHYGRICPIETPEGASIGLINSLASLARVNKYGFIETPYKVVKNGKVTSEIIYISPIEERGKNLAQADAKIGKDGKFEEDTIICRNTGDYVSVAANEVDLIEVSPQQIVSFTTSLIPFLENDDANRALMGSNMQRQAVPLIKAKAPLVGTGSESIIAQNTPATILAKNEGTVKYVDSNRIIIETSNKSEDDSTGVDIYRLEKYEKSNHDTSITQQPLVNLGDKVFKGDVIADGPCTEMGELALGNNVKVAFMTWNGYNYEDAVIISEKLVRDDAFTSIHIHKYETSTRDTQLGAEEITRDIPNTGEEALKNLDESGIIHIGATVKPGDILVGKVTPKGETVITAEEKLLKAIFGEKSMDVRDTSLRVPPGVEGTITDVQVLSKRGVEKDERTLAIESGEIEKVSKDFLDEKQIISNGFSQKLMSFLTNKVYKEGISSKKIKANDKLTVKQLEELELKSLKKIVLEDKKQNDELKKLVKKFDERIKDLTTDFENKKDKIQEGNILPPGVLKTVKVFIATKNKLQPGDKIAGRHGNKGIISKIVPVEDMPYQENGEPVDILLCTLGVPSRMNIGQILETHLGWASKGLGKKIGQMVNDIQENKEKTDKLKSFLKEIYSEEEYKQIEKMSDKQLLEVSKNLSDGVPMATPVFDGAKEEDINKYLKMADLDETGQEILYDGKTGEAFARPITVGYIYILKLKHIVKEKIHARSVGSYSLVTQQPLGGKANFGGQRLGEMEVWALEAYGAAYTLQEMLTVKSDDVAGRTKIYESIIRGNHEFESGIPESFNVLVNELKALGISVDLKEGADEKVIDTTAEEKVQAEPKLIEENVDTKSDSITDGENEAQSITE